jgi:hypothetical protein
MKIITALMLLLALLGGMIAFAFRVGFRELAADRAAERPSVITDRWPTQIA